MKINQILVKPILTEKATQLAQKKIYMFQVSRLTNKYQIKDAMEKLYSVKVGKVAVTTRKGKTRRFGRKMTTKKLADTKVAYITLKEGKLDMFPQT